MPTTERDSQDMVEINMGSADNLAPGRLVERGSMKPSKSFLQKKGMPIAFQHLTYEVTHMKDRKKKVNLLEDVTGMLEAAQMTALMGPSGSGKTTLLDVLAGRKNSGTTIGDIRFGGLAPNQNFLRRYTGYVEQFDTLISSLTVREMFMYTAEMKRLKSEPMASKREVVDSLIAKLALTKCADTTIGDSLNRGISGGQAKRVNIGIALVTSPRVLFLDEPTSGLDSYTSNEVMAYVKTFVSDGVTICATIHSPTSFAFRLFDSVMMLIQGRVVYAGPNDERATTYFTRSFDNLTPASDYDNQAEWLTHVITSSEADGRSSEFVDTYSKSALNQAMIDRTEEQKSTEAAKAVSAEMRDELKVKRSTTTPTLFALSRLLKYRTLANYKDPAYLGPRIGDKLISSLIIMSLYWSVGDDYSTNDASKVTSIGGVLFMWSTLPAFGAAAYTPSIVMERPLFVRERSDGLYRVITYMLFKVLDETMVTLVISLVFSLAVYYAVALTGTFIVFWLAYLITLSVGIMCAYLVAALSPNQEVANAALPAFVVTWLFFSGFLLPFKDIPVYWKWYAYIVPLRYAWSAQMINQFEDNDVQLINGETVLEFFDLDGKSKYAMLGYECIFLVVVTVLAYLALAYKKVSVR